MRKIKIKLLLSFLFLQIGFYAGAAHWMTYYVYYETNYEQGPWARQNLLRESGFRYLAAEPYQDLFGTESKQWAEKMLSRLQDKKPEIYDWNYDLEIKDNSVFIIPGKNVDALETVKNEITATLVLNGFDSVIFGPSNEQKIWTIDHLSLPFLDLVNPSRMPETERDVMKKEEEYFPDSSDNRQEMQEIESGTNPKKERRSLSVFLMISGILNIILLILLFRKK